MDEKTREALAAMAAARVLLGLTAEALVNAADAMSRVPERPAQDGLLADTVDPLRPMAVEMRNTAHTLDALEDVVIRTAVLG